MTKQKIKNSNALILLEAATNLGIHTKILSSDPIRIQYTHKNKSHLISQKSFGINKSPSAKDLSKNKSLTLQTLTLVGLPTPRHTTISSAHNYQDISIPFPQVIKPLTGEKGKHIYLNIKDKQSGQKAVNQVLEKYPDGAIIETYHQGDDYRFLCLNFKLIGLSKRLSPTITGNGKSTIRQLIEQENETRFKTNQKIGKRMLNRMRNWPRLKFNLNLQDLSLDDTLPQGTTIILYPIPNFSTGGSVTTIDPKSIHPSLIKLAEKVATTIGLEICGIDILIKDLNKPVTNNATIIEVNSDPGLRLHDWPNQGKSQKVAQKIFKSIFIL